MCFGTLVLVQLCEIEPATFLAGFLRRCDLPTYFGHTLLYLPLQADFVMDRKASLNRDDMEEDKAWHVRCAAMPRERR